MKDGYRIFDSDMHVLEPADLWQRYIDPAFRHRAPRGDAGFVFSTDYPHYDTKYPEATARLLKLPIGEATKRRILWDNCARLYRVGLDR